jgi:16S rRNA (guanine(527)-N(7))-methyltransferase RsmG
VLPELEAHYELLQRWNQKLNLTSEESIERHYGESLFLAAHLPEGPLRIADVGSGAGFPGFPVAVVRPECTVTLIEAHQRKAVFLKEVSRGKSNIRVLARRVEDVTDKFDWVISRAVSFRNLGSYLRRLAPRVALLTGVEPPPPELGFEWDRIPLPESRNRYLAVSRETTT